jgi:hypothetical protein
MWPWIARQPGSPIERRVSQPSYTLARRACFTVITNAQAVNHPHGRGATPSSFEMRATSGVVGAGMIETDVSRAVTEK